MPNAVIVGITVEQARQALMSERIVIGDERQLHMVNSLRMEADIKTDCCDNGYNIKGILDELGIEKQISQCDENELHQVSNYLKDYL